MKKLFIFLAAMLTLTTMAYAQIGSNAADLVFTPVTPCRLFDTRLSQGGTGSIPAAGIKGFAVWGQTSFAAQGGAANNCGVVANADTAAVAVNLTVVLPATAGFITAYPTGAAQPLAATVNFNAGDIKGNFAIVNVQQTGSAPSLNVYSTSNVDVVGDVVGYYSKPVATQLVCLLSSYGTVTIPAYGSGYFATPTACNAGYSAVSPICENNNSNPGLVFGGGAMQLASNSSYCIWRNTTGAAINVLQSNTCCRIPGR